MSKSDFKELIDKLQKEFKGKNKKELLELLMLTTATLNDAMIILTENDLQGQLSERVVARMAEGLTEYDTDCFHPLALAIIKKMNLHVVENRQENTMHFYWDFGPSGTEDDWQDILVQALKSMGVKVETTVDYGD